MTIRAAVPRDSVRGHASLFARGLMFAVLAGLCGIFVAQLHLDWSLNPSYSYGWVVPFLAAYSLWNRWSSRPEPAPLRSRVVAFALVGLSAVLLLPLRVFAKANPDWRLVSWAVGFSLVATALALFFVAGGVRWARHFAFPVLFCLVAIPWPSQFEQSIVQQLMRIVAGISADLLNAIGIPALQRGNVIELTNGVLGVEDACSGIRSLQASLMLSLFLGEFYSLRWPRRFVLVAASAVVAFVFNVGRTFFLSAMANYKGIESLEHLHDPAGMVVMIGCLAALWAVSVVLARGGSQDVLPGSASDPVFSRPMLIGVAAWLCLVEGGSELWFDARERQVPVASQWAIAWPNDARTKDIPIPKGAGDLLNYNEGRAIEWDDSAGRRWNLFFFKWLPGRTAALSVKVHRPDICLPASGFTSLGEPRFELLQVNGVSLPTRAYRFLGGANPVHVYYCYWDGTVFRDKQEMIEEDWTMRGRLKRVFSGRRERGAQTLELAVWGELDDASADAAAKSELSRLLVQQH